MLDGEYVISAGTDGWIKWWNLADIDAAEADEIAEVAIQPIKEISIQTENGEFAHILNVVRGNGIWLVNDVKGRLWKLNSDDFSAQILLEYHSGSITDLALSDSYNMAVTCSEDGVVKVWDYLRGVEYYSQKFIGKANTIDIMRRSEMNKGRVMAVGFETGILRILQLSDTGIEIGLAMKAHDGPITFARFAPNQMTLVTCSRDGEIFFFDTNGHLDLGKFNPICLL
jgi:WD40 repeat protein